MPYQFAKDDLDFSDYASGRVLYNDPGAPAFPVRMASEIFQRALARLQSRLPAGQPLTLYDPCCGGAYHLTALGLLHGEQIRAILASDIDPQAVRLAGRNLGLLHPRGLAQRQAEIEGMLRDYGKPSHVEALRSAGRLLDRLAHQNPGIPIHTRVFEANALDPAALEAQLAGEHIDLVFSDVPYGQLSAWTLPPDQPPGANSPVWTLLETLLPVITDATILAIAADKSQKITHAGYRRVEHFQIGKRQAVLLEKRISM